MITKKKSVFFAGCIILCVATLLLVYTTLISFGVIRTRSNKLIIRACSIETVYNGEEVSIEDIEILEGKLTFGHEIKPLITGSLKEVGEIEAKLSAVIVDSEGIDVTDKYELECINGTIKVLARDITIKSGSSFKVYDGKELKDDNYYISQGTLVEGHRLMANVTGSITNAGTAVNEIYGVIYNENDDDVSKNYNIIYDKGTLTVMKRKLVITTPDGEKEYDSIKLSMPGHTIIEGSLLDNHNLKGDSPMSITEIGSVTNDFNPTVYDENNNDVTCNYEIEVRPGTLTINPITLYIEADSASATYNGKPLEKNSYNITHGSLLTAHKADMTVIGSQTEVGQSENKIFGKIVNRHTNIDVSHYYNIEYSYGTLTVNQRKITVRSSTIAVNYNGVEQKSESSPYITAGSLVDGHNLNTISEFSATDCGVYDNVIECNITNTYGEDVTNNYDITYLYGIYTIKPREISISSESLSKVFDNTPLQSDINAYGSYKIVSGNAIANHQLVVELNNSITGVGSIENTITSYVLDSNGNDVSYNYKFIHAPGTLTVLPFIGGVGDVTKDPLLPSNILFYQVKSSYDGALYLRDKSYGNYKNGNWTEANEYYGYDDSYLQLSTKALEQTMGMYSDIYYPSNNVTVSKVLKGLDTIAPYNTKVSNLNDYSDVKLNIENVNQYSFDCHNYNYFNYYKANLTNINDRNEELQYRNYVYENYLEIPSDIISVIEGAMKSNKYYINEDDVDKVAKVRYFLQTFYKYNISFSDYADNIETMKYFLTASYDNEGNCQHFASAATLILRYLGIPARYVTGYLVNAKANQYVDVMDSNGHAWVEIYIDGFGWTNIEVTSTVTGDMNPTTLSISSNKDKKQYDETPLTNEEYSYSGLNDDHQLELEFLGSQTNIGNSDNVFYVKTITDSLGRDVSNFYIIEKEYGLLTVTKIDLKFITGSAHKKYDGTPLTSDEYMIAGSMAPSHIEVVEITGSQTEVGTSKNKGKLKITNEAGEDITDEFYNIVEAFGELVVSGDVVYLQVYSEKDSIVYLRDKSYGNYNGFEFVSNVSSYNQTSAINPLDLTSNAIMEHGATIEEVKILPQMNISFLEAAYNSNIEIGFNIYNDIEQSGTMEKGVEYVSNYVNYDYFSEDVYTQQQSQYSAAEEKYRKYVYDTYLDLPNSTKEKLKTIAKQNNLYAQNTTIIKDVRDYIRQAAKYDLQAVPSLSEDAIIQFLTVDKRGVCRHFASAATAMYRALGIPARYTTGFYVKTEAGSYVDVKEGHAWVEVYINGMGWVIVDATPGGSGGPSEGQGESVPIEKKEVVLTPKKVTALYEEGMDPIVATELDLDSNIKKYIAEGYEFYPTFIGSQSTPGISTSTVVDCYVMKDGVDVTDEFYFKYKPGKLQIYLKEITIETNSYSKVYDGTPLESNPDGWTLKTPLMDGDSIFVSFKYTQTIPGKVQNAVSVTIVNSSNQNVTHLYKVKTTFGYLSVTGRPIEITAESASKEYDGTPLTCNEYQITGGLGLLPGHTIEVEIEGETIDGFSENIITKVSIYDESNHDITYYYYISTISGYLMIE